jgi:hypothetical protein
MALTRVILSLTELAECIGRQIDNDIMKAGTPVCISIDNIESINRFQGSNGNPGFFQNFPFSRFLQGFTDLNAATGNGPQILSRRLAPSNKKNFIVFENYGPDGNSGLIGVRAI